MPLDMNWLNPLMLNWSANVSQIVLSPAAKPCHFVTRRSQAVLPDGAGSSQGKKRTFCPRHSLALLLFDYFLDPTDKQGNENARTDQQGFLEKGQEFIHGIFHDVNLLSLNIASDLKKSKLFPRGTVAPPPLRGPSWSSSVRRFSLWPRPERESKTNSDVKSFIPWKHLKNTIETLLRHFACDREDLTGILAVVSFQGPGTGRFLSG